MKNSTFLHDVQRARKATDTFHIWWLGRQGYLLKWQDRYVIMDPVLTTQTGHPQGASEQDVSTSVVTPVELNFVDITTISRVGDDEPDRSTIRGIWTVSPAMRLVVPASSCSFVASHLGIHPALPIGISDGDTLAFGGIEISAVATVPQQEQSEQATQALGYIYHFGQGFTVFHSSRLLPNPGLINYLKEQQIDVALLPIGTNVGGGQAGSLSADSTQVVELAKQIQAKVIVPHISDSVASDSVEQDQQVIDTFVAEAEEASLPVHHLELGQRWSNAR